MTDEYADFLHGSLFLLSLVSDLQILNFKRVNFFLVKCSIPNQRGVIFIIILAVEIITK